MSTSNLPGAKDKPLFTPGPLTTSQTVKQAMLRDLGSRDTEFIRIVREIRDGLLSVAGVPTVGDYECVLLQGSGTFGIEAVLTCCRSQRWEVVDPGQRNRMANECVRSPRSMGIAYTDVVLAEDTAFTAEEVDERLKNDPRHFRGGYRALRNDHGYLQSYPGDWSDGSRSWENILRRLDERLWWPPRFDFEACQIDYLVSSANKCIEGVPGFSFCIANRASLEQTEGWSRTLSFDLYAQWKGLEGNGQFRFTPPTHTMLAFRQALDELKMEGGVPGREARYQANCKTLIDGMTKLGFECYLAGGSARTYHHVVFAS